MRLLACFDHENRGGEKKNYKQMKMMTDVGNDDGRQTDGDGGRLIL